MNVKSVFLENEALWLGRFQPPTIGHLIAALSILGRWEKLTIGIVHRDNKKHEADEKWSEYLGAASDITDSPGRNPFSPQEVFDMWNATIQSYGLENRVQLRNMARAAFQPNFNGEYHPNRYDLVDIALTLHDPETDRNRKNAFAKLIDRPITYVLTPFKIHVSDLRQLAKDDMGMWETYLPEGAREVFARIGGAKRMLV